MNRRVGWRARTDFRVTVRNGCLRAKCRGVELSTTGIVLERGHAVSDWDSPLFVHLEISLPERHLALRAVARPVWWFGSQQALKFVRLADVDRLTLAEHLDIVHRGRSDFRTVAPWFDFRKVLEFGAVLRSRRAAPTGGVLQ